MKWINFNDKKPPIDTYVLVWIGEDFNRPDIGTWNGNINGFCNGWDTMHDLSKYREIKYWSYILKPPK